MTSNNYFPYALQKETPLDIAMARRNGYLVMRFKEIRGEAPLTKKVPFLQKFRQDKVSSEDSLFHINSAALEWKLVCVSKGNT